MVADSMPAHMMRAACTAVIPLLTHLCTSSVITLSMSKPCAPPVSGSPLKMSRHSFRLRPTKAAGLKPNRWAGVLLTDSMDPWASTRSDSRRWHRASLKGVGITCSRKCKRLGVKSFRQVLSVERVP